jgi:hypothetical protein
LAPPFFLNSFAGNPQTKPGGGDQLDCAASGIFNNSEYQRANAE